jgi:hypothetical protein
MKTVRFSKVVGKCGKPEVYLLMSETDPIFHKALEAEKILSLSEETHGSGSEFGTVGYDKKRHGQLLLFPKSLKAFADTKVVGIKYDLLEESASDNSASTHRPRPDKPLNKKSPAKKWTKPVKAKKAEATPKKVSKKEPKKVIPFPRTEKEEDEDDDSEIKTIVRQAMHALEKGNSVAGYNLLKRIIPDP